jgi:3-dehydroquinate synthase
VRVSLGERSYDVLIGTGLLDQLGRFAADLIPARRAFIVCDDGLPEETRSRAERSLMDGGLAVTRIDIHASEREKSLATFERVLKAVTATRHERQEPMIALGGGVVGDVAGFAAACYRRGVPIVQCPTTLLAMVDASVGGKTGVNLADGTELRKNLVGAFHQPRLVVADIDTLGSLPDRHLRAGLAECVKHAMLCGDDGLMAWTEQHLAAILGRDHAALVELVSRNVAVKAGVVAGDEREHGDRALLNLGHTFGHAFETIASLTPDGDPSSAPLLHGEAVALGLVAACRASLEMGRADRGLGERVAGLLECIGLPTTIGGLPKSGELLSAMMHDKKVLDDRLRLVIPAAPGRCEVVMDPPAEVVTAGLDAIREHGAASAGTGS